MMAAVLDSATGTQPLCSVTLNLEPLDVLFFRDARPFDAAPRATSGLPLPPTVAGAVRTWLLNRAGADLGALGAKIRSGASFAQATAAQGPKQAATGRIGVQGPWFVKDGERLATTPATIVSDPDANLYRLDPLADGLPGWSPSLQGMRPLWHRGRGSAKPRGGYLRPAGLSRFLVGGIPLADQIVDRDAIFGTEDRVGIGIDRDTQAAKERMIYAVRLLRLCPGVELAVDLVGSPEDLGTCPTDDDLLPLGGEARRVIVRRASAPWRWPEVPTEGRDGCRLVLLTTPAPFGGWCPGTLTPVAAAVPNHVPVSGWDLARGRPKPNRFAVPAGSVYFLDRHAQRARAGDSLCGGEDAAVGWGAYVEGVWNYA